MSKIKLFEEKNFIKFIEEGINSQEFVDHLLSDYFNNGKIKTKSNIFCFPVFRDTCGSQTPGSPGNKLTCNTIFWCGQRWTSNPVPSPKQEG